MQFNVKLPALISCALLLSLTGCSSKTNNSQEEVEIRQMDSTANAINEKTKELEDRTSDVENSLEKLDKDFSEKN